MAAQAAPERAASSRRCFSANPEALPCSPDMVTSRNLRAAPAVRTRVRNTYIISRRPACVEATEIIQEYRFADGEEEHEGIGFNRSGQLVCWSNETSRPIRSQEVLSWFQRMEMKASDSVERPRVGVRSKAAEKFLRMLAAQGTLSTSR